MRKWNPRVGVAYQLNAKTVIRSGYGIFFGAAPYSTNSAYVGDAFSKALATHRAHVFGRDVHLPAIISACRRYQSATRGPVGRARALRARILQPTSFNQHPTSASTIGSATYIGIAFRSRCCAEP